MLEIPFLSRIAKFTVKKQSVADTVDWLNYFVTASILSFFAMITSAKQYFGKPIQCFTPDTFTGGQASYAEDTCFVSNFYYIPFDKEYGEVKTAERADHIGYYRWVPIMLAIQCICFHLPNFIWGALQRRTAMNPESFMKEAEKVHELVGQEREDELNKLAKYFMETISTFGTVEIKKRLRLNPRSGKNTIRLYLAVKALYVANIIIQIIVLSKFFGGNFFAWGIQSFSDIFNGVDGNSSRLTVFPRIIMCDFNIRRLSSVHPYTMQCVLMMNMINEKLYLFLFFWFIIISAVTVVNFVYYLMILLFPSFRYSLVLVNIDEWRRIHAYRETERKDVARFVDECLHPDGVLLLQFVSEHIGGKVAYDLANKMLGMYTIQELGTYRALSDMSFSKSYLPETPEPDYPKKNNQHFSTSTPKDPNHNSYQTDLPYCL